MRPEPCKVQGCHAPHVVHGGIRSSDCGISSKKDNVFFDVDAMLYALCD